MLKERIRVEAEKYSVDPICTGDTQDDFEDAFRIGAELGMKLKAEELEARLEEAEQLIRDYRNAEASDLDADAWLAAKQEKVK